VPPIILEYLYKTKRNELIKNIRTETAAINDSLLQVFSALNPFYLEWTRKFASTKDAQQGVAPEPREQIS
jgi:hypothetical protein